MQFVLVLLTVIVSAQALFGGSYTKDTVRVGVYLHTLTDFNLSNNTYQADVRIWMRYKNVALHPEELLRIENAKEVTELETLRKYNNGWHWVLQRKRITVQHVWDIQHFPYNTERLNLIFTDPQVDAVGRIYLPDADPLTCNPEGIPLGWRLQGSSMQASTLRYPSHMGLDLIESTMAQAPVQALVSTITLVHIGEDLIFKLYVGLFVAFLISWFTFFIEPIEVDPRFGLSVGGIFAAVGNKYILDGNLPDISATSLTDWLHALTFLCILLTVALGILSLYLHKRGRMAQYKRLDRLAAAGMLVFYVTTVVVLVWHAAK